MMDCITILAQAAETARETTQTIEPSIVPIDRIWEQIISLGKLEALTFVSFGAVCLFYGWRVFKVLVVISFALLGLIAGIAISDRIGGGNNPLLGILMGVVFGIVSVPLMRWAVSILGAAAGATLTAGLWYAFRMPEEYIWAGGLIGLIAGGMISFIVFRIAVMLFSSLGGSGLMVAGVLALLHLYPQTEKQVEPNSGFCLSPC
ncbi:MAG: hypothetical protein ACYS71_08890 [Planctomycetota bacterium]|jgi:hypothetical protein